MTKPQIKEELEKILSVISTSDSKELRKAAAFIQLALIYFL